jgi:hypothetical protein
MNATSRSLEGSPKAEVEVQPDRTLRQYVVLYHSGVEPAHYDLMFDLDGHNPLITFRLPRWPIEAGDACGRLKDHRRVYLTFEGEIPGNGRVDRVAEGQVHVETTSTSWILRLPTGEMLAELPFKTRQT